MKYFNVRLVPDYSCAEIVTGVTFLARLGTIPDLDFEEVYFGYGAIVVFDHQLLSTRDATITTLPSVHDNCEEASHIVWVKKGSFNGDFPETNLRILSESDVLDRKLIRQHYEDYLEAKGYETGVNDGGTETEINAHIDGPWAVVAIDSPDNLRVSDIINRMPRDWQKPPHFYYLGHCIIGGGFRRLYIMVKKGHVVRIPDKPEDWPSYFTTRAGEETPWELPVQLEVLFDGERITGSGTYKHLEDGPVDFIARDLSIN